MLASPVEKSVHHRWFVMAYIALCIAITIYVLINCIAYHQYASFSAPLTFYSAFLADDGQRTASSLQNPASTYFCNNSAFGWNLTASEILIQGPTNYTSADCTWWDMSVMASFTSGDTVGVPTLLSTTDSAVDRPMFVVDSIEHITLYINHGLKASTGAFTFNPATDIVDSHGNVFATIPSGSFFRLTLKDLMTLTGLTLDDAFMGPMRTYYRHSGMLIRLQIEYSNMRAFDMSAEVRATASVNLVPTVWGVIGSYSNRPVHGLKISMDSTGNIGIFDFYQVVLYVTSAIVLFQVAKGIVLFVWDSRKWFARVLLRQFGVQLPDIFLRSPPSSEDEAEEKMDADGLTGGSANDEVKHSVTHVMSVWGEGSRSVDYTLEKRAVIEDGDPSSEAVTFTHHPAEVATM